MKRHDALVTLSSEHHTGLVWARRLTQLSDSEDTLNPGEVAHEFLDVWDSEINPHFRKEEDFLLPIFAGEGDYSDECIWEMLQQHIILRREIWRLRQAHSVEILVRIGELLMEHIRHEERIVFPFIEEQSSNETLREINDALEE
ncbi:MAG: hemerythrin domain-containing protein [Candidatus Marinimicrobia bacterium]|nr:hemerythrin domain-containing protein [Candidatus Neomarinimicrobiota bacterium]MCF7828262.1 hemerythrin domain-containing protein [Candidatus Neomarinimicrobiota bacterium]MCF7879563.1 hemerythrin domain-containing protein [Candidatus Neomarinimicrobiota bacterium]